MLYVLLLSICCFFDGCVLVALHVGATAIILQGSILPTAVSVYIGKAAKAETCLLPEWFSRISMYK